MNIFIWGNPSTTDRDLERVRDAGFTWQKSLFQWRDIEPMAGVFDFSEADRVVRASAATGVKIIARLDFQPTWARADGAHNGPPDNYEDFGRFVSALVTRYRSDSPIGQLHAIEVWNEPNLDREWGNAPINQPQAGDYVRLLKTAYEAAKAVDPSVDDHHGRPLPDRLDRQHRPSGRRVPRWMYEAGAKQYFDVLGAHGPGFKAPPTSAPTRPRPTRSTAATAPSPSGASRTCARSWSENGDAAKQIWLLEFGWTTDKVNPAYAWHRVLRSSTATTWSRRTAGRTRTGRPGSA